MLKKLFVLFLVLFMVGCATKEPIEREVIVYKTELVYVTVPSHLLKPNVTPSPPDRKTYSMSSALAKEELLINYSRELITELRMCVADKRSITKIMDEKMTKPPEDVPKGLLK